MPIDFTALATAALEKFVPLPSHTNLMRLQFSPASLGAEEFVFRKMVPYLLATCVMALATPE